MGYIELRGNQVTKAPESPGLYAWYFRPVSVDKSSLLLTLTQLLSVQPQVNTTVVQRYGMRYVSSGMARIALGADQQAVAQAIARAFDEADPFLEWFFQAAEFVHFCRPIYIGIAKNLRDRVYVQHYTTLIEFWEPEGRVSKFLSANPDATVQTAMDTLELQHSFALEARTCGIVPRDLMVSVLATDEIPEAIGPDTDATNETSTRRALERLLHLLSDPVLGRR